MLIVLDTNVLVSALLKKKSVSGQALDRILGDHRVALDARILEEYRAVLNRPRFMIDPDKRDRLLESLASFSVMVQAHVLNLPAREILDPKDLPFAEVAVATGTDALITGNKRHFAFLPNFGVMVLSPAEFLNRLQG